MSPIVAVQYTPSCAICGVLGGIPWMLVWRPDGRWDALCEHCSLTLLLVAKGQLADVPEST